MVQVDLQSIRLWARKMTDFLDGRNNPTLPEKYLDIILQRPKWRLVTALASSGEAAPRYRDLIGAELYFIYGGDISSTSINTAG